MALSDLEPGGEKSKKLEMIPIQYNKVMMAINSLKMNGPKENI